MDDRKLKTLLATVRAGSFSKAAEELICTQSAVTQTMNSLEDELGVKLVERSRKGVTLSKEGEELFPFIIEAESALQRLQSQAEFIATGRAVPLRIASFSSIANSWLSDMLIGFKKECPDTEFEIRVGSIGFAQMMLDGEVDMVLGDSDVLKGFRWYPLMKDPYYAIMPKSLVPEGKDTITQEEFAKYKWIIAPLNAMDRNLEVLADKDNSTTVITDDDGTLISMVAKGLGVTAVPELFIKELPDEVVMLKLDPQPTRELGIYLPPSPSPSAEAFRDYLLQRFPDEDQ